MAVTSDLGGQTTATVDVCTVRAEISDTVKDETNLSKGSTSIMEYLGRLKGIADQLGVAGYLVFDKEKVQQTLSGLGPDFYSFTTALEVLPILPTFNELKGKLLQHETTDRMNIPR
ncbi:hypothetical protein EJ110_NYTH52029 [Nymphaea thermarum]|nr:hypothetical protein EJ110_NYTH52029 [Nymphaea thermarum]